jgi:hypothetical protein
LGQNGPLPPPKKTCLSSEAHIGLFVQNFIINVVYFNKSSKLNGSTLQLRSMLLERINTSINMSDHLTKGLQTILFHRHANFILGHIPPMYSPVYESIIGTCTNHSVDITHFVLPSFTTPTTAAAARIHAPILSDFKHNPWLIIIGHGQYNPLLYPYSPNSGLLGGDIG